MAFVRHQFELSKPQDDGKPLIVHLQLVSEKMGRPHPMLVGGPELPDGLQSLWATFLELHESRGSTGWGPQRITFLDLFARGAITGHKLAPREVDLIRKADNLWLAEFAPKPKETT
jgi:hypothetical protein